MEPSSGAPTKIDFRCPRCGSGEILRDAYASWDPGEQEWVLHGTYDSFTCEGCGQECKELDEVEWTSESETDTGETPENT